MGQQNIDDVYADLFQKGKGDGDDDDDGFLKGFGDDDDDAGFEVDASSDVTVTPLAPVVTPLAAKGPAPLNMADMPETYVTGEGLSLSPDQVSAVNFIAASTPETHPVIVLTGGAGSGKSTVIDVLQQELDVAICATTGRAAVSIGGVTVDRLLHLNRSNLHFPSTGLQRFEDAMAALPDRIIIDEASMVGRLMANYIYDFVVTQSAKQIILVGDWGQARPVKDDWITGSHLWTKTPPEILRLTENHRQADDAEFADMLNRLRVGQSTAEDHAAFTKCQAPAPDDDSLRSGGRCYLFGSNAKADNVNSRIVTSLISAGALGVTLTARFSSAKPVKPRQRASILSASPIADGIPACIGARVMITKNGEGVVNGDTGTLVAIRDGGHAELGDPDFDYSAVRLVIEIDRFVKEKAIRDSQMAKKAEAAEAGDNTDDVIIEDFLGSGVGCTTVEFAEVVHKICDDNGKVLQKVTGYPIRLGYAYTTHKVQGQTLDNVYVALNSLGCFRGPGLHGLVYVALSRVRSLDSLSLDAWQYDKLFVDSTIASLL